MSARLLHVISPQNIRTGLSQAPHTQPRTHYVNKRSGPFSTLSSILGIWWQPQIGIDQLVLHGWCCQYHTICIISLVPILDQVTMGSPFIKILTSMGIQTHDHRIDRQVCYYGFFTIYNNVEKSYTVNWILYFMTNVILGWHKAIGSSLAVEGGVGYTGQ